MAGHAGGAGQIVIIVGVAIAALPRWNCVLTGERKSSQAVIKVRVRPTAGVVASGALSIGKRLLIVFRIGGAEVIRLVAGVASSAGQIVIIVDVAIGAGARRHRMHAGQRESCRVVVELGVEPVIGGVARVALVDWKCLRIRRVFWVGRVGVVRLVTGIAFRRHCLEIAVSTILVASVALHSRMGAGKREAVIVILNVLDRDLPSAHGMALLAIGAKLPPVDIGVTILASVPHIIEDHLHVTLRACHGCVHTPQRIFRLVVIEFRNRANRLPSTGGMAVLARNVQIPVRATRDVVVGSLGSRASGCSRERQKHNEIEYARRCQHSSPLLALASATTYLWVPQ